MTEIALIISTYLISSIPFGLLICKMKNLGDLRTQGSGNIGATNVYRVAGMKMAALTLFLDFFKGAIMVHLTSIFAPNIAIISAATAVIAHIFPIWLKFKGGKGVATSIAVLGVLSPQLMLCILVSWALIFILTRMSSASSIGSFLLLPVFAFALQESPEIQCLSVFLALLVVSKHHANILRIIKGQEKKF